MKMEINIYNLEGKQETEKLTVSKDVFAGKINKSLLHLYTLWYLANARSGSANTKTKAEVRGGGKKPYRQKGTGGARRGSSRTPLTRGGGVIFGPKPRSFAFKFTKKMKRATLIAALSSKKENLIVVKDMKIKGPKTKEMARIINNFDLKGNALFVDIKTSEDFLRAAKNIKYVKTYDIDKVNAYDLLKYEKVFFTVDAVKKIEEKLAK